MVLLQFLSILLLVNICEYLREFRVDDIVFGVLGVNIPLFRAE